MAKLFRVEPHVRSMIDEDGAVLLDLKGGKYFSLNGVAASIWSRAERQLDETEIVDELLSLYDGVSPDRLRADMASLATGLEAKGLVRCGV